MHADMLHTLVDRPILPFDLSEYGSLMQEAVAEFKVAGQMIKEWSYFVQGQGEYLIGLYGFLHADHPHQG